MPKLGEQMFNGVSNRLTYLEKEGAKSFYKIIEKEKEQKQPKIIEKPKEIIEKPQQIIRQSSEKIIQRLEPIQERTPLYSDLRRERIQKHNMKMTSIFQRAFN